MSEELDRRIAIEVMREPEPTYEIPEEAVLRGTGVITSGYFSGGGNWEALDLYPEGETWKPIRFSSNLEHAMKAVHELMGDEPHLLMEYYRNIQTGELEYMAYDSMRYGHGPTLPIAICRLLLTLVAREVKEAQR